MYKRKPQPTPIESSRHKFIKNGLRAVRRSESYGFRSSTDSLPVSSEMRSIQSSKTVSYASPQSFWSDRYSVMAAPLGAEMFLHCERNIPETVLGGPRYYMDEVLAGKEPDARPRFPYDDVAHQAAKTVTGQYKKNLRIRHAAAKYIQKIWRGRRVYIEYIPVYQRRAEAARTIHQEFRANKLVLMSALRRRSELKRLSLVAKPWQPSMSEEEVDRRYREKIAIKLTRFVRMIPKLSRKQRGRGRRLRIHAVRLQSLFRGNRSRERVWSMVSAQIMIAYVWKRFFRRKYTPLILKIQRAYRNYCLRGQVILIQKVARGFFHRRRAYRLRLRIASEERLRGTLERSMLKDAIRLAAASFLALHGLQIKQRKFMKWKRTMVGKVVDPMPPAHIYHTLSENMLFFDPAEIESIQSHSINLKEPWPKDLYNVGAANVAETVRIGAVRENIAEVFKRYEFIEGKYPDRDNHQAAKPEAKPELEAEIEEAEIEEVPTPVLGRSATNGKASQSPSSKPGSANTGKFSTGPKTPSSAKTPTSAKSAKSPASSKSVITPTSANNSSSKTPTAKTPSGVSSLVDSTSTKAKNSPTKGHGLDSISAKKRDGNQFSAKGFMQDDWAVGSVPVASETDIAKPLKPDDYYDKKEKLMWILLDSFTNWTYPRIDGYAMLICQEYLTRRAVPKQDLRRGRSLWGKLFSCALTRKPLPAPRIHTELDQPKETAQVDRIAPIDEPSGKRTGLNLTESPLRSTSSQNSKESPSRGPSFAATGEGVTRLGLDTVGGDGSDEYAIDVLPIDNWGMLPGSVQVRDINQDFEWSPVKATVHTNSFNAPSYPTTKKVSTRENVFDSSGSAKPLLSESATAPVSNNISTPIIEKTSSKLVQFMGTKRTVPPESRSLKLAKSSSMRSRAESPVSEKKPLNDNDKVPRKVKDGSKKIQSFESAKPTASTKFANISQTLRPSSRVGSASPEASKMASTKPNQSAKGDTITKSFNNTNSLKRLGPTNLVIPAIEIEVARERLKFVLPPSIPRSPRMQETIPFQNFVTSMDLYTIWDRKVLFDAYCPNRDLQFSVDMWSRLPDAVIAKAIFVRKWTLYFDNVCKIFLERHRAKNPPRRRCPRCLMPSYVDIRRDHHCGARCFPLLWVSKDTWDPALHLLTECCTVLTGSKFNKRMWSDQRQEPM